MRLRVLKVKSDSSFGMDPEYASDILCLSVCLSLLIFGVGVAGRNTVWAASFNAEHTGHRHELNECSSGFKQITSSDKICYILTDQSFSE